MKKLIFSLLLLATTQISIAQTWNIGYPVETDVTATLHNDTLTISGTGAMRDHIGLSDWPRHSVSTAIINVGITRIGNESFYDHTNLTAVYIPNGVISIGGWSFFNTGLTEIIIPNTVTAIAGGAFFNNTNLRRLVLEGGASTLTLNNNIVDTSVDTIYVGRNLTVGWQVFGTGIRSLTIGNDVTSIAGNAFQNNASLLSLTIGYNVTTIGANAFAGATSLAIVTSLSPIPPTVSSANTFSGVSGACLLVPVGSRNLYETAANWGVFSSCIEELDGDVPHTVIFNPMGGSSVATRFVRDGETMTKPTSPNRTEYGFAGWYREIEFINRWNFDTDVVTSDITLFAKWISFVSLFDSIAKLNIENLALREDTAQLQQLLAVCEYDLVETRHALSLRIDTINYQRDTITELRADTLRLYHQVLALQNDTAYLRGLLALCDDDDGQFRYIDSLRNVILALQVDTANLRQLLTDCEYDLVETRHALSLRIDTINYQRDTILKLRLQLEICGGNNENSNTEILEITVEGLETAREGTNFSITANCGQDEVNIVIVADDPQATVEINGIVQNAITLDLDLHGDNVFAIKITALNGDYSNYTLTVNRPIPFEQITIIRWGQAVSVINNPENNGGYVFNSFRWFRNDEIEPFSTSQWWSANAIENPRPDDIFRVEVVTTEGRTLSSCHEIVVLNTAEINLFPNPALVGQTFYVEVDIHADFLQNAMLTVYNAMGVRQGQLALQGRMTPVNLNLSPGVHVVVLTDSNGFRKELKTVIR